jgi:ribosomal protein L14E/L6E/L27E
MKTYLVVKSVAGRDKERLLAVVGESDGRVLVCDGKERPIERPKPKNKKHLVFTGQCLNEEELNSNKSLRRALKRCEIKEDSSYV